MRRSWIGAVVLVAAIAAPSCARPDDRPGEAPVVTTTVAPIELGSAGSSTEGAPSPPAPAPTIAEADVALGRAAFSKYCGECHDGHVPTAKPKALAVFDLADSDWIAKLSAPQIEKAKGRLQGKATDAEKRATSALLDAPARDGRGQ